jgi:hypothetical protein
MGGEYPIIIDRRPLQNSAAVNLAGTGFAKMSVT